jgi:hypothetical protein
MIAGVVGWCRRSDVAWFQSCSSFDTDTSALLQTTLTTPTTRVLIDIPDMVKLSLCVILSCIRLVTEMKMAPEI